MASSGKADRGHPGHNGGLDTCRAVLDDETVSRRRPELFGGVEEEIGRRLTACDHCRAKQVVAKIRQKPSQFQFTADLLRHAARRDAAGQSHRIELLKTLKTATVSSTPLAIWRMSDKTAFGEGPIQWN